MDDKKVKVLDRIVAGSETPRVDLLELLLETFSEGQLRQVGLAAMAACASSEGEQAEVVIRFKNGHPRWVGMMGWEELEKP